MQNCLNTRCILRNSRATGHVCLKTACYELDFLFMIGVRETCSNLLLVWFIFPVQEYNI